MTSTELAESGANIINILRFARVFSKPLLAGSGKLEFWNSAPPALPFTAGTPDPTAPLWPRVARSEQPPGGAWVATDLQTAQDSNALCRALLS